MLDLRYRAALADLAALAPTLAGAATVTGTAKGTAGDLAVRAGLSGEVGAKGVPRGPVQATVDATGLPGHPAGTVSAQGTLEGAPLNLALHAERGADGTLHATIDRADWKSLHAEGALTLAAGATLPDGRVSLRMTRLEDLRALVGQAVTGSVTAEAELGGNALKLDLQASHAGIPGSSVGRAALSARVANPTNHPSVAATLDAEGIEAGGTAGNGQGRGERAGGRAGDPAERRAQPGGRAGHGGRGGDAERARQDGAAGSADRGLERPGAAAAGAGAGELRRRSGDRPAARGIAAGGAGRVGPGVAQPEPARRRCAGSRRTWPARSRPAWTRRGTSRRRPG